MLIRLIQKAGYSLAQLRAVAPKGTQLSWGSGHRVVLDRLVVAIKTGQGTGLRIGQCDVII